MPNASMEKLYQRYQESKQYKDRWLALYKDLYAYVIPDRDAFNVKFGYRDDGKPVTLQVWDTTAMTSAYQRALDLHGLLMPMDRVWGRFALDKRKFSQDAIDATKGYVDEVNDTIMSHLNQSNLSRIVSSSNLDLVGGTAALWVESFDDDTPLYFRSIPAVALYVEYSNDDVVNTCWYQCKKTGHKILEEFPKYKGKMLSQIKGNANQLYEVTYGQIRMEETKFYLYAFLEEDNDTPLWETERGYNQVIIYRDRVRPGESDGRGIGLDMLPTIRDTNRMVMYSRQNLAFKANPPIFYDNDAYFNPYSVRQWSGAWFARRPGGRNPVEAMEMPNYPDVLEQIKDLQEQIRSAFQVDPLGEVEQPVKSATEISIRENRAQRTASTDISRLINELPKQVYEISAKILAERRLLKKDRSIGQINVKKFQFDFQSPLYDLQKDDDLSHFSTNLQLKQQFFGQGAAMATVDLVEANKFLTDRLNLPSKLFVSDAQLQKYIQAAGAQAAQAQQQGAPTPTTAASNVQLPQASQQQI